MMHVVLELLLSLNRKRPAWQPGVGAGSHTPVLPSRVGARGRI